MSAKLKCAASGIIDTYSEELLELSGEIWKNPELGFKEHLAHSLLTGFLERRGFEVQRSFAGLETAFRATFGSGRPNVCVICEYDALPVIGHACGHNLIAEAGIAAGLGLKAALECEGAPKGMVTVMGTPAEETSGGKLDMIQNGAFSDVDIAMMVHPSPSDIVSPTTLGVSMWNVEFTGKSAHAAAYPWEGVNALDAAVMAYNSISLLRQQMKPTWRVHGVALNGGGTDPAIIPASTSYFTTSEHQRSENWRNWNGK
jgi:amidohydrolase